MTLAVGGVRAIAAGMVAMMVVIGGLAVAPAGAAPTFPPERATRVLILGDSVLASTAGLYGRRLAGRDVTVDAVLSRTTGAGADRLAELGSDWDVVIVLLGYNDGGSARAFQPAATRILDQLAGVPRVTWLSLHEVRPGYAAINQFLAAQVARRPNLRTADWNAISNANPGALDRDGIHPRGAGPALLADLVAAQVSQTETDRVVEAQAAAAAEAARVQAETEARVRAETEARVRAANEARIQAENEARAQALRDSADAQERSRVEAVVRNQQDAHAALAGQQQMIDDWQLAKEAIEARTAARHASEGRAAAARDRRAQRIGLVARSADLSGRPDGVTTSSVAVVGLAVLAVTGAGTAAVVARRRRRGATPRRALMP